MFMLQTLQEYLDNPMGKGSNAITNRKLIQQDLNNRYEILLTRYKDFDYKIYRNGHEYYIHFLIPSESERENTYDVIIHFTMEDENFKNDATIKNYFIKVFSNCPSFTYTYAWVYNDYGMMIPFLRDKYDEIVLKDNPIIRNPGEVINYEKSIYFACYYIFKHKFFMLNKVWLNSKASKLNIPELRKIIRNTDKIKLEIDKEEERLKRLTKKVDQAKERKIQKKIEKLPYVDKGSIPKVNQIPRSQPISTHKKKEKIKAKSKLKPTKTTVKKT